MTSKKSQSLILERRRGLKGQIKKKKIENWFRNTNNCLNKLQEKREQRILWEGNYQRNNTSKCPPGSRTRKGERSEANRFSIKKNFSMIWYWSRAYILPSLFISNLIGEKTPLYQMCSFLYSLSPLISVSVTWYDPSQVLLWIGFSHMPPLYSTAPFWSWHLSRDWLHNTITSGSVFSLYSLPSPHPPIILLLPCLSGLLKMLFLYGPSNFQRCTSRLGISG